MGKNSRVRAEKHKRQNRIRIVSDILRAKNRNQLQVSAERLPKKSSPYFAALARTVLS
jgi:predicted transcriptional regulator